MRGIAANALEEVVGFDSVCQKYANHVSIGRTDWTRCNVEPQKPPKYRKKRIEKTINTGWTQSKTKNLILSFLLSHWLRVRIPPRSQKTPGKQGFFHGKIT